MGSLRETCVLDPIQYQAFEAGKVVPVIDGPCRLSEVPEAFPYFGEGRHLGKVVITVEPDGRS